MTHLLLPFVALFLATAPAENPKPPARAVVDHMRVLDGPNGPLVWTSTTSTTIDFTFRLGQYAPINGGHLAFGIGDFDELRVYGTGFIIGEANGCGLGARVILEQYTGDGNYVDFSTCSPPLDKDATYRVVFEGGRYNLWRITGELVASHSIPTTTKHGQFFMIPLPGGPGRPAYLDLKVGTRL